MSRDEDIGRLGELSCFLTKFQVWRSCEASAEVVQLNAGEGDGRRGQQKISGDNDAAFWSRIVMAIIVHWSGDSRLLGGPD